MNSVSEYIVGSLFFVKKKCMRDIFLLSLLQYRVAGILFSPRYYSASCRKTQRGNNLDSWKRRRISVRWRQWCDFQVWDVKSELGGTVKVRIFWVRAGSTGRILQEDVDSWKRSRILAFGDISEIFRWTEVSAVQHRLTSVISIHIPCTASELCVFCVWKTCVYSHFMNPVGAGFVLHTQRRQWWFGKVEWTDDFMVKKRVNTM